MGFTVQHYENVNSSNGACWAVVLDHEHILFVGTYRQCEDWLDLNEAVEMTNRTTRGSRVWSSMGDCRSEVKQWFHALVRILNLRRVGKRAVSFLSGEAGHSGAVESIALAVMLCGLYVGSMFVVRTMTWDRVQLYRNVLRGSITGHMSSSTKHGGRLVETSNDGLEIACDLAQSP